MFKMNDLLKHSGPQRRNSGRGAIHLCRG